MKRVCAFLLCGALMMPPAFAASEGAWPAWAEEALPWGQNAAISQDFLTAPAETVSRGMAAQLLYEAAGRPAVTGTCPFSDVPEEYADAVTWAAAEGILTGVGEGRYEPSRMVTRQEFAAILWRQAGAPEMAAQGLAQFGDAASVAEWARPAVVWSLRAGVMDGQSEERLAPAGTITVAEALVMLERAASLPDGNQLRADLEALTASHRPVGSQGEADAVQYLKKRFEEMGYTVTLQPYTDSQGRSGNNVIAVKEASFSDADILILSAHHDSVSTAYGANDNASGVAALLYAAQALKDVETDTELRFISFTDEENGKNGSRAYTASLTEEEKDRMIGAIQFDMLGGLGSDGTLVCTMDGEANWLSDLLQKKDPELVRDAETASDHASLQLAGVPSVLLMQEGQGYLYHSAADVADQLDPYAIAAAAETAVAAAQEIGSPDTASYRELDREQGEGYTYRQTRQNVIYFSSSTADTEAYIGAAGELADTWEISGEGWTDTYESYRYSMRWFDGEMPINTYYQYRNGFLERIQLRPEETGYTAEQMQALIETMYGAPTSEEEGQVSWADPVYSKYITLSSDEQGCLVTVGNYSVGITNVLSSYPVRGGQADISDPEDALVWDYLCSILPHRGVQPVHRRHQQHPGLHLPGAGGRRL
ncbi:M20/M25/M40 family metallo-hydrolase [uncultured Intestinimonas sp.]|uniref:M20/M25/M40 family metallo-hydrolase n=1 Tax=uncultured Intestinimonas sp. TaxID=1689265 RepID=UPI0025E09F92|nr:M20/M25/M40 family metallo-hydrolase [uncultured Intestinimonas sp.]